VAVIRYGISVRRSGSVAEEQAVMEIGGRPEVESECGFM
jgi:hypothetical protein